MGVLRFIRQQFGKNTEITAVKDKISTGEGLVNDTVTVQDVCGARDSAKVTDFISIRCEKSERERAIFLIGRKKRGKGERNFTAM